MHNGVDMLISEHADIFLTFIVMPAVSKAIGAETVVQQCLTQCTYVLEELLVEAVL